MLSSRFTVSEILHYRQLFSINFPLPSELSHKTWEISQKTWEIFQKRGRFSKKRGSFFQPPPREDFSQQIETQIKQKMEELQP